MGQDRPTTLGDGFAKAQVYRVETDLFEVTLGVIADSYCATVVYEVGSEPKLSVIGAGHSPVAGCGIIVQPLPAVGGFRQPLDGFVLENEVAKAVENGFSFVYFYASQGMRAVANNQVAAAVDGALPPTL